MPKDCVINELSLLDIDDREHDPVFLLDRLAVIPGLLGLDAAVWAWDGLLESTPAGVRFQTLIRLVLAQPRSDRRRRILRQLRDRLALFQQDMSIEASFGGAPARGLAVAAMVNGLSISVQLDRWDHGHVEVELSSVLGDEIAVRRELVRHAARETHLRDHLEWQPLAAVDRLRVLLAVVGAKHYPASAYAHGKHVRGADNETRRRNAASPAGKGQYFAERNGTAVSDATIEAWEKEVLDAVRVGTMPCHLERGGSASTYHVLCELPHDVGYAGGSGNPTRRMRVEWSEGWVHSHPRPPR